jgi:hypothetical protein
MEGLHGQVALRHLFRGEIMSNQSSSGVSDKSWLAALLLSIFLGPIGVHRFFVGKIGTGILQLFTLGGLGIWALIDIIMIATKQFKDKDGRVVSEG